MYISDASAEMRTKERKEEEKKENKEKSKKAKIRQTTTPTHVNVLPTYTLPRTFKRQTIRRRSADLHVGRDLRLGKNLALGDYNSLFTRVSAESRVRLSAIHISALAIAIIVHCAQRIGRVRVPDPRKVRARTVLATCTVAHAAAV